MKNILTSLQIFLFLLITNPAITIPAMAEVLCKNKKSGVVAAKVKCAKTESTLQPFTVDVSSNKATADNTTAVDINLSRLQGSGGSLNNTGLNLSVIGDSGGDSTNVGLLVNTTGADNNYCAIFQGGNVGIGVTAPDEALQVAGRIHLDSTSAPSVTSNKLYNNGGTLYWNGTAITSTDDNSDSEITGITAGSGLSGGGTSGNVTLSVNTGTSSNNIVQLNSSAQLPAVSGANLTSLNASSLASGLVSDSRLSPNVSLLGSSISLTGEVAGVLPVGNGGTGATSLTNFLALGTNTTGNYVASLATGTGLSGGASGSEGAALTLSLDQAISPTWTGAHSFQNGGVNIGTTTSSAEALHLNGRLHMEQTTAPSTTTDKLYNVSGDLYFNGKNLSQTAAGGDITAVNNGTGLTGGGTTGDVTLAVDVGTVANKILQLNTSAQIPAVSGALLTNLNASNLGSGTVSDARLSANVSMLGSLIDLTSEITGVLPIANGGTGQANFTNLFTLGTHTTGNYVATVSSGTGISVSGAAGEATASTVSVDASTAFTWTGTHTFSGTSPDLTTGSGQNFTIVPNGTGLVGIGTNSPNAMLDVSPPSSSSATAASSVGSSVTVIDTGAIASGTDNNTGHAVSVLRSGTSTGGNVNATGIDVLVTGNTNASSTTTGLNVSVSGADDNYAALFSGGKVGIGLTNPTSDLDVSASTSSSSAGTFIAEKLTSASTGAVASGSDSATAKKISLNRSGATGGTLSSTGIDLSVTNSSIVTTGTDTTKGLALSLSRTGANGGTIDTTGIDLNLTGDAGGTSKLTGLKVAVSGADQNIAASLSGGSVSIGGNETVITDSNIPSGSLVIDNGAFCIDDGGGDCADNALSAGAMYAESSTITNIDLAENFPVEDGDSIEAGDIVIANTKVSRKCLAFTRASDGTNQCAEEAEGKVPFVTRSNGNLHLNKRVLGVVSTKPGIVLGGFGEDELIFYKKVPLALAGRVPVKVSNENGSIEIGDRITPGSTPGVGKRAEDGDLIVGIALESLDSDTSSGKILVLVK